MSDQEIIGLIIVAIAGIAFFVLTGVTSGKKKEKTSQSIDEANMPIDYEYEKANAMYDASSKGLKLNLMEIAALREMSKIAEQYSCLHYPKSDD